MPLFPKFIKLATVRSFVFRCVVSSLRRQSSRSSWSRDLGFHNNLNQSFSPTPAKSSLHFARETALSHILPSFFAFLFRLFPFFYLPRSFFVPCFSVEKEESPLFSTQVAPVRKCRIRNASFNTLMATFLSVFSGFSGFLFSLDAV